MKKVIIDVRERDEYAAEHIKNSINIPLSELAKAAPEILKSSSNSDVILMCRSGKRAGLAKQELQKLGAAQVLTCEVFEGGILEWKKQGKAVETRKKRHLPIMRQVQLIAGSMILLASFLSIFVNPKFVYLAAFFGAGLTVAGATGFCGMAQILCRMPWNQVPDEASDLD